MVLSLTISPPVQTVSVQTVHVCPGGLQGRVELVGGRVELVAGRVEGLAGRVEGLAGRMDNAET